MADSDIARQRAVLEMARDSIEGTSHAVWCFARDSHRQKPDSFTKQDRKALHLRECLFLLEKALRELEAAEKITTG